MTLEDLTAHLTAGHDLDAEGIRTAATALLEESEETIPTRVDFLKALADKGESPAEIAGFVEAFLDRAVDPTITPQDIDRPMIDVCGTGGDKLDLFNVSTTAMFLLVPGGLSVVKHGNRSITSKSGGADVLEALGVAIDLPPESFALSIKQHGIGFLFAPQYHPAFKAVGPVRAALAQEGRRTIFNLLGPLLNPVRPQHQVIGVFDESLPPAYADILGQLGRKSAWAIHGKTADGRGVDEMSTMGPTRVAQLADGTVTEFEVSPSELGLDVAKVEDLQGGDAEFNAGLLRDILGGKDTGAKRDIVLLNAAAAFVAAGVVEDLSAGLGKGLAVIEDGSALATLEALVAFSATHLAS